MPSLTNTPRLTTELSINRAAGLDSSRRNPSGTTACLKIGREQFSTKTIQISSKKKKKSAEKTSVVRSILERMRLLVGARCALGGCLSSFSLFRIAMRTGKILSADPLALPGF